MEVHDRIARTPILHQARPNPQTTKTPE